MLDHIELNLGVIGPSSMADTVQRCIHEMVHSKNPDGWDDQLGDEPAADFMWVRKYRHKNGLLAPTDLTDVITDFGFTAGSLHRHAEAGIMFRYGGKLPKDFGPGSLCCRHRRPAEIVILTSRFICSPVCRAGSSSIIGFCRESVPSRLSVRPRPDWPIKSDSSS